MVLGFVLLGMAMGISAAAYWVVAGGSVLVAIAVYSLVSTVVVLSSALASHLVAEAVVPGRDRRPNALPAAE